MLGAAFGLGFMIGPFLGGVLSDPATGIGVLSIPSSGLTTPTCSPAYSRVQCLR